MALIYDHIVQYDARPADGATCRDVVEAQQCGQDIEARRSHSESTLYIFSNGLFCSSKFLPLSFRR